jgi:metal-sulfur cluster biosynthetic enzyme
VIDPELGDNVVDLGMVHRIDVDRQSGATWTSPSP